MASKSLVSVAVTNGRRGAERTGEWWGRRWFRGDCGRLDFRLDPLMADAGLGSTLNLYFISRKMF